MRLPYGGCGFSCRGLLASLCGSASIRIPPLRGTGTACGTPSLGGPGGVPQVSNCQDFLGPCSHSLAYVRGRGATWNGRRFDRRTTSPLPSGADVAASKRYPFPRGGNLTLSLPGPQVRVALDIQVGIWRGQRCRPQIVANEVETLTCDQVPIQLRCDGLPIIQSDGFAIDDGIL